MRPASPPAPAKAVPVTLVRKEGPIRDDPWLDLDDETAVIPGSCAIVSLPRLETHAETLKAHRACLGVRLAPDEAVERLAPHLPALRLVAIIFPKFRDGRGYTAARLLRERFGYGGEIRAVGDVLRDQLCFMARCGIDSFLLKDPAPEEAVAWAFSLRKAVYQPAADQALPVWRRRVRARDE